MTGSISDAELTAHAEALGAALVASNLTVAAAESCTGGWIAKALTDVAGSSAWFAYGVVTYSNRAKQHLLGVSSATLERYGAVSERCVQEMANGVLRMSRAQVAVAVSGIAGPDGGSDDKPVGTVWFAYSWPGERVAERMRFEGDRDGVRRAAVAHALVRLSEGIDHWLGSRA